MDSIDVTSHRSTRRRLLFDCYEGCNGKRLWIAVCIVRQTVCHRPIVAFHRCRNHYSSSYVSSCEMSPLTLVYTFFEYVSRKLRSKDNKRNSLVRSLSEPLSPVRSFRKPDFVSPILSVRHFRTQKNLKVEIEKNQQGYLSRRTSPPPARSHAAAVASALSSVRTVSGPITSFYQIILQFRRFKLTY